MSKFDVKTQSSGDKLTLQLAGTIDEDADFSKVVIAGTPQVEVDLEQLKSINSCGIREWIKWISQANSAKISLVNCPKVIVDQINMVDGFLPTNGKVLSFYVPYYNDDAGSEKNVLFRYGSEFSDDGVASPAEVKDDEGNVMEVDVIEAKYFKFLNRK